MFSFEAPVCVFFLVEIKTLCCSLVLFCILKFALSFANLLNSVFRFIFLGFLFFVLVLDTFQGLTLMLL